LRSDTRRRISPMVVGYVFTLEDDGSVSPVWISNSYTSLTGYSIDDLGRSDARDKMVPPEDHHIIEEAITTLKRGEEWAGDHRMITKSGDVRWLRFFSHPLRDDEGRITRLEGSGHDVTELRQLEAELRSSNEALNLLDEAVLPILWTTDRDLMITSLSGAGLQLYGWETDELVGVHMYEALGNDDPGYTPNVAAHRALNGERTTFDLDWRGHSFRAVIEPLRDGSNEIIGTAGVGVAKDVLALDVSSGFAREVLEGMEGETIQGGAPSSKVIEAGDLKIDPVAFSAWKGDELLKLSPTEFRLLRQLASHPNQAMTREDLLRDVWQHDFMGDSRLVDMAINRLRAKIEDDPRDPSLIVTVRGIGYRFDAARA
jgi:PAS domain S-box-containing protein